MSSSPPPFPLLLSLLSLSLGCTPAPGVSSGAQSVQTSGVTRDGEALAAAAATRPHPRLLATAERFATIRSQSESEPHLIAARHDVLTAADALLDPVKHPVFTYDNFIHRPRDGDSLISRTYTLAMAFKLTGDPKYLTRLWDHLRVAADPAEFKDWNNGVCLDVANFAQAFALAYDWLHEAWTPAQRGTIFLALVRNGVNVAARMYAGAASGKPPSGLDVGWVKSKDNHNIACNGGLGLAALAVSGDVNAGHQTEVVAVLSAGLTSIRAGALDEYVAGGYPEGMRYWNYSLSVLMPYLWAIHVLDEDSLGLAEAPGIRETGYFPLYLRGTSGQTFNFSDATSSGGAAAETSALGTLFNDDALRGDGAANTTARSLLWYDPAHPGKTAAEMNLPLDRTFPTAGVSSMRGSWSDMEATFVAIKGGANPAPLGSPTDSAKSGHADLDQGTFVLDALGERWAEELGDDSYSLPGYWDTAPGDPAATHRWSYYRKRAEGSNTLVFETSQPRDQLPALNGIDSTASADAFAWTRIFLTSTSSGLRSWHRGARLFHDRKEVIIRDEVTPLSGVDAWWFMHTRAEISILTDGRSALLTRHGKRLLVRLSGSPELSFFDMPAEPLPLSPHPAGQTMDRYTNAGIRKLAIHVVGAAAFNLSVQFTPLQPGQTVAAAMAANPVRRSSLADWLAGPGDGNVESMERETDLAEKASSGLTSVVLGVTPRSGVPGKMTARALDAEGKEYVGAKLGEQVALRWSSADPDVATVDSAGMLLPHRKGTARIWVFATDPSTRQRVGAMIPVTFN